MIDLNSTEGNPFAVIAEITAAIRNLPREKYTALRDAVLFGPRPLDWITKQYGKMDTSKWSKVRVTQFNRAKAIERKPPPPVLTSGFLEGIGVTSDPASDGNEFESHLKMIDLRDIQGRIQGKYKQKKVVVGVKKETPPPAPVKGKAKAGGAVMRSRKPAIADKWAAMPTPQLAVEAAKHGYVETPAPNGGVRKMRLLNWCRHHIK